MALAGQSLALECAASKRAQGPFLLNPWPFLPTHTLSDTEQFTLSIHGQRWVRCSPSRSHAGMLTDSTTG